MKTTPQPTTFRKRLEQNRDTNASVLAEVGIRPELAREVSCPVCGMRENALFWCCRERTKHFLHLRCPRCERGSAWYSLKKNAPIESFLRLTQVLCGSAVLLLLAMLGSLTYTHPDLLPQRLTANMAAAREEVAVSQQQLEGAASVGAVWLSRAVSVGHERSVVLQEMIPLPA